MANSVQMFFWDVQHGHATYIKSPNGRHIVIDLGTGDYSGKNANFSPLLYLKSHYNVNQLDYVIITHPHLDHIDDILNFDLLSPKVLLRPILITNEILLKGVREQDRPKYEEYCSICNRYNQSVTQYDNPDNSDNYGGLKILRFIPSFYDGDNLNNYSIVIVLEYAGIKVVIPGDNERACLDELMKNESFNNAVANADILLAPHHGRDSAYNNDFVNLVKPRLSIVSDGKYCDTSANGRYSDKSRGWTVYKDGKPIERKCLTTNSDGEIYVEFGNNDLATNKFLNVRI